MLSPVSDIDTYLRMVGVTNNIGPAGFRLLRLVDLPAATAISFAPRYREFYQINVLENTGEGIYQLRGRTLRQRPATAYFISPNHLYAWRRNPEMRGYLLYFQASFIGPTLQRTIEDFEPLFGLEENNYLELTPNQLVALNGQLRLLFDQQNTRVDSKTLHFGLLHFLYTVRGLALLAQQSDTSEPLPEPLRRYLNLVADRFGENWRVKDYAANVNISPNHLNALCRRHLGRTAKEIVLNRRLEEARALLRSTRLDIQAVGYRVGFSHPAQFSRFFRSKMGIAPGDYRKQFR
ncbi:MAG: AraC family transcriptional regulator [Bacteroidota bacterium]